MTQPRLVQRFVSITAPGATRRKIVVDDRPEDDVIFDLKSPYLYWDAADPTLSIAAKSGHNMVGGDRIFWTGSGISLDTSDAAFNDLAALQFTGRNHDVRVPDMPTLASYKIFFLMSIPASVITALETTNTSYYLLSVYTPIDYPVTLTLFSSSSGATRGWSFTPETASGNGHNILWTTYPASEPDADVPFVICVEVDRPNLTSKFYFNDGATPISVKDTHTEANAGGGDNRYWLGSLFTSTTLGFTGKIAKMLIVDDSVEATAMTAAQRATLMTDWLAAATP